MVVTPATCAGSRSSTGWTAADSGRRGCSAHRIQRANDLAEAAAVGIIDQAFRGKLDFGVFANVLGSDLDGLAKFGLRAIRRCRVRTLAPAKPSNLRAYSSSAASPRARSRPGSARRSARLLRGGGLARDQRAARVVRDRESGSNLTSRSCSADIRRCPARRPAFRRGMMVRTVDSSRMVLTASQSPSLRVEMVGRFSAGSTSSTFAGSSFPRSASGRLCPAR